MNQPYDNEVETISFWGNLRILNASISDIDIDNLASERYKIITAFSHFLHKRDVRLIPEFMERDSLNDHQEIIASFLYSVNTSMMTWYEDSRYFSKNPLSEIDSLIERLREDPTDCYRTSIDSILPTVDDILSNDHSGGVVTISARSFDMKLRVLLSDVTELSETSRNDLAQGDIDLLESLMRFINRLIDHENFLHIKEAFGSQARFRPRDYSVIQTTSLILTILPTASLRTDRR